MISYRTLLVVFLTSIIILFIIIIHQGTKINELEKINKGISDIAVVNTVDLILDEPEYLFEFFEDAQAWEEIEAVPYSQCYRHLVDGANANYIVCKAI